MTGVSVDRPPNPPKLTGIYERDMAAIHDYLRAMTRVVTQVRERTGGTTDMIAATTETAATASATATASQGGATIPTTGGAVALVPADPLSYTTLNVSDANISIAGHTRTGAASALVGAACADNPVARGVTYYVYYSDAGDAGGVQTYHADSVFSNVTAVAGYRIVGTIYIPDASYIERKIAGEI